jgi:protein-S-isoprenylcysteine O-methyltransferase Ste14
MEHLLVRQVLCAVFLLLLGGTRYYFVFASAHPADRTSPATNWLRHIPAYFASTVWVVYVAWLLLAPVELVSWDWWTASRGISHLLGWIAVPFLAGGLLLFCYSHHTIGRYWSMRIRLKQGHQLVTRGPYGQIRHPLYTALFFGYLGTLLALQSWMLAAWFPVFVASYRIFAEEEESIMERAFGEAYRAYRRRTGMFLPKWKGMGVSIGFASAQFRERFVEAKRTRDDRE